MSFLAPGFLYAGMAVAAAVVALHFIVTRQPRSAMLPTARFVPDMPAIATARAARPSDLALMLLRALIALAAGAALARPVLQPPRNVSSRIILLDVSRSTSDIASAVASTRTVYRDGDALIVFDSATRPVTRAVDDTLRSIRRSEKKGNLSAAIIAAVRAASTLRDRSDSLELVIVSAFDAEEWDSATDSVRRLWPGRARLIRASRVHDSSPVGISALTFKGPASDPMSASVSLASPSARSEARLLRGYASAPDSEWAAGGKRVLIEWLAGGRPRGALSRSPADSVGGVTAGQSVVIAAFERDWKFSSDSLSQAAIVARWIDGEPAVWERKTGQGCLRSVAIPVPAAGDLPIRSDFVQLVIALTARCASERETEPISAPAMAALAGPSAELAPRSAFRAGADIHSPFAPWLLGIAIVAWIGELIVRDRKTTAPTFTSMGEATRASPVVRA